MENETTVNDGAQKARDSDSNAAATSVTRNGSVISNHPADGDVTHCHSQQQQQRDRRAEKTLIFASILTFVFIMVEFTGKAFPRF
jgi:hypothetical protein